MSIPTPIPWPPWLHALAAVVVVAWWVKTLRCERDVARAKGLPVMLMLVAASVVMAPVYLPVYVAARLTLLVYLGLARRVRRWLDRRFLAAAPRSPLTMIPSGWATRADLDQAMLAARRVRQLEACGEATTTIDLHPKEA